MAKITLEEAEDISGVPRETLEEWAESGVIPPYRGFWTEPAAVHARIVKRLHEQGHPLEELKREGEEGRLTFGYVDSFFTEKKLGITFRQAAEQNGVDPETIRRLMAAVGLRHTLDERPTEDEYEMIQGAAMLLNVGFPRDMMFQLARVYGMAIQRIADAQVHLFHLHMHEPMIRSKALKGKEMSEALTNVAAVVVPQATRFMDMLQKRYMQKVTEQTIVNMVDGDLHSRNFGRLSVAIAFVDLVGYTEMTEEYGDEMAADIVDQFIESVYDTVPEGARVLKVIGDGVMVVAPKPKDLVDWVLDLRSSHGQATKVRSGIHYGEITYREGDYYGREVNQASRIADAAEPDQVLITAVVSERIGDHYSKESIGTVALKGVAEPVELFAVEKKQ